MLLELHVRNLALIEKADAGLGERLSILTGEIGAGKSIVIGPATTALGGKASRESIRHGADYVYIELVSSVSGQEKTEALKTLEVEPTEDGPVIVSRKTMASRNVGRISDEMVTTAKLRQITDLLLDIRGQHEYQPLLYKSKHLEILDAYIKANSQSVKQSIYREYQTYRTLKGWLERFDMDSENRIRETDLLRFEIQEIEGTALKEDEKEALTVVYHRFAHSQKIAEGLGATYETVGEEWISRALREVGRVAGYDGALEGIWNQLYDADSILEDAKQEISSCMDSIEFDEETFHQTEERLDLIHSLQAKYGATVPLIHRKLEEKRECLDGLEDYDFRREQTRKEPEVCANHLEGFYAQLAEIRKKISRDLVREIRRGLVDLNFLDVDFDMGFRQMEHFGPSGQDEAQLVISTNPGQPMRPLKDVASSGELSRIILAIKTVLADSDDIPTLTFDGIDTGTSGRTAQRISEKLSYIAGNHQVICITHLPQIAAMADARFEISKSVKSGNTLTTIRLSDRKTSVEELARLLGGARITKTVRRSTLEIKELANRTKQNRLKSAARMVLRKGQ